MSQHSSGQLNLQPRILAGEGWVYEVWTYGGTLLHTTKVYAVKSEAHAAAKDWKRQQKQGQYAK